MAGRASAADGLPTRRTGPRRGPPRAGSACRTGGQSAVPGQRRLAWGDHAALPIRYPEELPVSQRRDEIAAAIRDHQVVIVAGETGSGKTTQLPKICLELGPRRPRA